jgi:hypothetical protein
MQALQPSAQVKGVGKKDGAPQEDDFINMDNEECPFCFAIKWNLFGFYNATSRVGSGCPNHEIIPRLTSPHWPCQ